MPLPVKIVGGGVIQQGVEQAVDPTFNAARVAIRPLDYQNLGQFLGHYSVAKNTSTTVSIGAGGTLAYLRWTDSSRFCVPLKVRVSAVVASAISTGTIVDVGLFQGHGSSGAGSGGNSVVLSANDFLQVQEVTAGPTTGGIQFGFTFEWAEVSVF